MAQGLYHRTNEIIQFDENHMEEIEFTPPASLTMVTLSGDVNGEYEFVLNGQTIQLDTNANSSRQYMFNLSLNAMSVTTLPAGGLIYAHLKQAI